MYECTPASNGSTNADALLGSRVRRALVRNRAMRFLYRENCQVWKSPRSGAMARPAPRFGRNPWSYPDLTLREALTGGHTSSYTNRGHVVRKRTNDTDL
jgi:hypothetical protein